MPNPTSAEIDPSLEHAILDVIRENLLPDLPATFGIEDSLYDVGLDSMGIMQMVLLLDERFGCTIQPTELTRVNFSSVASLATLIRKNSGTA